MRNAKSLVLAASLAANLAAAVIALQWASRHSDRFTGLAFWRHDAVPIPAHSETAQAAKPIVDALPLWHDLSKSDLASLVARLRAAGFPPKIIRAIIAAQIHEMLASKRAAALAQIPQTPYWKRRNYQDYTKVWMAMRAVNREESDLMRATLGDEPVASDDLSGYYQKLQYGSIPAAKVRQIQEIVNDYNELSSNVYSSANGIIMEADRKQIAYLQQQEATDLGQLLTPDELLEYQMRNSPTANQLNRKLTAFDPTEDEYQAIFKIQQTIDIQNGPSYGAQTPAERQQRTDAQTAANQQIAAVLGPDRYAQYQLDTDPSYLNAYNIAQRLGLPDAVPSQIQTLKQNIDQQAAAIYQQTQAGAVRNSQLGQLSGQAASQVTAILGADGMAAYQQTGGARWTQVPALRAAGKSGSH